MTLGRVRWIRLAVVTAMVVGSAAGCSDRSDAQPSGSNSMPATLQPSNRRPLQSLDEVFDGCAADGHPAHMSGHAKAGQPDHCKEPLPTGFRLLTNWGTKPQWLSDTEIVFVSSLMGDVYSMNIRSGELHNLTGHFRHAGFTRVHPLWNGDLLLVGLTKGAPPAKNPLEAYSEGMFQSDLFVLEKPFDAAPVPLHAHAWEGVAVSRTTGRIAYGTSTEPFWVTGPNGKTDFAATVAKYEKAPSELRTAVIVERDGVPTLTDERVILSKAAVGAVFLEAQDFAGEKDRLLLASAYGLVGGTGDALTIDLTTGAFEVATTPTGGYEEWEGVSADGDVAFMEIDPDAVAGPGYVDLYTYRFSTGEYERRTSVAKGPLHAVQQPHEPVFGHSGRWALTTTGATRGWPGMGAGIEVWDLGETG